MQNEMLLEDPQWSGQRVSQREKVVIMQSTTNNAFGTFLSCGPRSTGRSFAERLSELGSRIWQVIQSDDEVSEMLFQLADEKLSLDKVSPGDTRLDSEHAEAIMGEGDPETLEERRLGVPPDEWLKYSLFNLALDWVLDQALMRMKLEQKWPFQGADGLPKP